MDPPTRGQPLHGTICILLVLFNLPPKDTLSIKDKVSAPKVFFIRRLYCTCDWLISKSFARDYIPQCNRISAIVTRRSLPKRLLGINYRQLLVCRSCISLNKIIMNMMANPCQ